MNSRYSTESEIEMEENVPTTPAPEPAGQEAGNETTVLMAAMTAEASQHSEYSLPQSFRSDEKWFFSKQPGLSHYCFTYDIISGIFYTDADRLRNGTDENLSWAATASNALTASGWAAHSGLNVSTENSVFDYFTQFWSDVGGTPAVGFDWFFSGQDNVSGGNLFPEVNVDSVYQTYTPQVNAETTAEDVMATIKSFFLAGMAVSLRIHQEDGSNRTLSAWGYEVDADGKTWLYVSSPDDDEISGPHLSHADGMNQLSKYELTWSGSGSATQFKVNQENTITDIDTLTAYDSIYRGIAESFSDARVIDLHNPEEFYGRIDAEADTDFFRIDGGFYSDVAITIKALMPEQVIAGGFTVDIYNSRLTRVYSSTEAATELTIHAGILPNDLIFVVVKNAGWEASSQKNLGALSNVYSVTTESQMAEGNDIWDAINLSNLTSTIEGSSHRRTFRWQGVSNLSTPRQALRFEYSRFADFRDAVIIDGLIRRDDLTIDIAEKGTYYWRMISYDLKSDFHGDYAVAEQSFEVMDEAPIVTADINGPTRENVTLKCNYLEWDQSPEYSRDAISWLPYPVEGVLVDDNMTVYFRGVGGDGSIVSSLYKVTNIDRLAPDSPWITADTTDPTNHAVTLSTYFSDDSVVQEYSPDGFTWTKYAGPITVTRNGIYQFRATDDAGNSSLSWYKVTNIDMVTPTAPSVTADTTDPTNHAVTLTAKFSDDAVVREYSLDGSTWIKYTGPVAINSNGAYQFRAADAAGNVSDVTWYKVNNIDMVAPTAPSVTADTTSLTNHAVTLTANFSDDAVVREYSLDGSTWIKYTGPIEISSNGAYQFRAADAAGNVSDVTWYKVNNIDMVAPTAPSVTADTTDPTNGDVTLTAKFSDDAVVREYSLDGKTWQVYTGPVAVGTNGTYQFRATDAAGNQSSAEYKVGNIDKIAPDAPWAKADITDPTCRDVTLQIYFSMDAVKREYSTDGVNWLTCGDTLTCNTNGIYRFRATDDAGNVSTGIYKIANIDRMPPDAPAITADVIEPTRGNVTLNVVFDADSACNQYSFDGETWQTCSTGLTLFDPGSLWYGPTWNAIAAQMQLRQNGSIYFRSVDALGNSSTSQYTVANIDKTAPDAPQITVSLTDPTNQPITVTAVFAADSVRNEYTLGGNSWKLYTGALTVKSNTNIGFRSTDAAGNQSTVSYYVSNIDTTPPAAPVIRCSGGGVNFTPVTVTAAFDAEATLREYSLDGETWLAYTGAVLVIANGTFRARSRDAAGNLSEATRVITEILPPDPNTPGPVAVTVRIGKRQEVTLQWTTPEVSGARIAGYEVELNGQTRMVTGNVLKLGILPTTGDFTVRVQAIDTLGRYGSCGEPVTFTIADVTAPTLGKVTAVASHYTGVVSWSGSDDTGIARYEVTCAGRTQTVTTPTADFTDLAIGRHQITVQAFDAAGNASKIGRTTVTIRDTTPPDPVTGLNTPAADSKYNARLSWESGTDNSGKIAKYEVRLDDGKIRKSSKNSLTVSGLSVGVHSYQVRAVDNSGNIGDWSDIATFMVKDMTAPDKVAIRAKVKDNTLSLAWTAPKDNVGVTGYILKHGVNLENAETLAAGQTSFRIDNLAKGKYQYQIVAVDAAGNQSKVKSGTATIRKDFPVAVHVGLPDAIPSLEFASAAATETQSSLPQLDQVLPEVGALTAYEPLLAASTALDGLTDTERKTSPLFAIGA